MNPAQRTAQLATLLDGTSITLLSLTENGETITLRRDAGTVSDRPTPAASPAGERIIVAPCAGVLLLAHPLRPERLVEPGRSVAPQAVLGLLRIGPLLIEIQAPVAGTLLCAEAVEGELVGFGTPLFRLSTEEDLS